LKEWVPLLVKVRGKEVHAYQFTISKVFSGRTMSTLSTTVGYGEIQQWPLWTGDLCSERQKLLIRFSRDELRLAFVDMKPLFAGVLMHRLD